MRFLVGPDQPGERHDDATRTWPGEPLYLPPECDTPNCACDRVFAGLASGRLTTVAQVADIDHDEATIVDQTRAAAARSFGIPPGQIDLDEAQYAVGLLTGAAGERPVGAIVRTAHLDLDEEQR